MRLFIQENEGTDENQRNDAQYTEPDDSLHCPFLSCFCESRARARGRSGYSSCSATIGFTAAALSAGISDASTPEMTNTTSAITAVLKSNSGRLKNPDLPPPASSIFAMTCNRKAPPTTPV